MDKNVKHGIDSLEDIVNLKPVFRFYDMEMVEWFEVNMGEMWCTIKSGLRYAGDEVRSPYYYEESFIGPNCGKDAVESFKIWWYTKNN